MVMTYKLIDTANGPLIQNEDNFITLLEVQELINLQEENANFIQDMTRFLVDTFKHHTDLFFANFSEGYFYPPMHITAYITAMHQFLQFKNEHWPRYQHSLTQTMTQVPTSQL